MILWKLYFIKDKFYEENGETDQIRELIKRKYIGKYKKNLMENCIIGVKGKLKKVKNEYYLEKSRDYMDK